MEEFEELIMRGYGDGVREAYNAAAEGYNEICAYPGSNRPRLPMLPPNPNRGVNDDTINPYLAGVGVILGVVVVVFTPEFSIPALIIGALGAQ